MRALAVIAGMTLVACQSHETKPCTSPEQKTGRAAREAGLAHAVAGEHEAAIEELTRGLALDPLDAEAWRWRGHCFNVLESFEAALDDYGRAIALEPADAWTYYAIGMAQHKLARYEAAIANYTRALDLDPRCVKALNWRGFTRKILHDHAGAGSDFERSLEIAPDDPWAMCELAKTLQARSDLAACERELRRAAELVPTNGSVRAQLGFLFAVRESSSQSIAALEAALSNHAPEETYARVWIWMQREDREHAGRELRAWFDESRIDDVWELQLAAFLLGEGTDEQLIARAQAETRSRVAGGAPPDFLECEAAFYAGLRREFRGERAAAHEFYVRALEFPAAEAWEWHMARVRARSVAR